MRHSFQITAVAAIFPVIALAGQAKATTLVLSSPFSADFIWNNDGTVSLLSAPLVDYTAVQQQSEVWSDFSSGSTLPAGSLMELSFSAVDGHDEHTVSFLHNFGTVGGTFSWSYDVSDAATPGVQEGSINAAILQTVGVASLLKTLVDNNSNTYSVDFTQTGTIDSGATSATFLPGATTLDVVDTMTVSGPHGSDATGVSNSFVERGVPEASTWVMMLLGFAGLGFAGYRSSRKSIALAD
jgi:PEP-CTERM motif